MRLPLTLVIDDQYGRDPSERAQLIKDTDSIEVTLDGVASLDDSASAGQTAAMVLCQGQERQGDRLVNNYHMIRQAVETGWGPDKPWQWTMVLLDAMFASGELDNGVPLGQEGDEHFGEETRARLAQEFPGLPLVMLTSKEQRELRDQRVPFLSKKGLNGEILKSKLLENGNLTDEQTASILQLRPGIVVRSPAMRKVFWLALLSARADASVLLLGETGVGKEVLAQFIHDMSRRAARPFVGKNIASIPPTLVDSELFGIARRTATGVDARLGLFQRAHTGTLFLDEIGNMAEDVQARVLRALQEGTIDIVGGDTVEVDIRLVSATSKDLHKLIEEGQFREDLYYRINTVDISIPPLRERREEIGPLAETFLQDHVSRIGKSGIVFSDHAKALLESYSFPGNVRQLRNLVEGIVIVKGNNEVIFPDDIEPSLRRPARKVEGGADVVESERSQLREAQQRVKELERQLTDLEARQQAPVLSLANIVDCLSQIPINPQASADPEHDPLWGIKPKLEQAVRQLLKRIAGAALEGTKRIPGDSPERTDAVRRIMGDPQVKEATPRILKAILGLRQDSNKMSEKEIDELIEAWRSGPH